MNFLLVYLCRFAVRAPSHIFSGFSRQRGFIDFPFYCSLSALRITTSVLHYLPPLRLSPALPFARVRLSFCVTASFNRVRWYRIFNRLSIIYAFRPRLRSRLTLGGRTFPRKPQTFDGEVSRLSLATYAGILSSIQSTAASATASARIHCSSTDTRSRIPKLRCHVLAPLIFGASSLDQ